MILCDVLCHAVVAFAGINGSVCAEGMSCGKGVAVEKLLIAVGTLVNGVTVFIAGGRNDRGFRHVVSLLGNDLFGNDSVAGEAVDVDSAALGAGGRNENGIGGSMSVCGVTRGGNESAYGTSLYLNDAAAVDLIGLGTEGVLSLCGLSESARAAGGAIRVFGAFELTGSGIENSPFAPGAAGAGRADGGMRHTRDLGVSVISRAAHSPLVTEGEALVAFLEKHLSISERFYAGFDYGALG